MSAFLGSAVTVLDGVHIRGGEQGGEEHSLHFGTAALLVRKHVYKQRHVWDHGRKSRIPRIPVKRSSPFRPLDRTWS